MNPIEGDVAKHKKEKNQASAAARKPNVKKLRSNKEINARTAIGATT